MQGKGRAARGAIIEAEFLAAVGERGHAGPLIPGKACPKPAIDLESRPFNQKQNRSGGVFDLKKRPGGAGTQDQLVRKDELHKTLLRYIKRNSP